MRYCFTGGEKAPEELFEIVNGLGHCRLSEGYGITECSPILTLNVEGDRLKGVGKPLPGISIKIVHVDTYQPLKSGEQGLILTKGPNVFGGYLNPSINSPFVLLDDGEWYSTGDLGLLDSNGALILTGRLKRFIKIAGEMISLTAIEEALKKKVSEKGIKIEEGPALAACAHEEAGEKTMISLYTRFPISVKEVNHWLRESGFSNLVKVSHVCQVDSIPLMGSGKIHYRALEKKG